MVASRHAWAAGAGNPRAIVLSRSPGAVATGVRRLVLVSIEPTPNHDAAVLLTPRGVGALAVVRVVGKSAVTAVVRQLSRAPVPGRATHAELRDARGEVIDDPVVTISTDGDVLDLCLHGGNWVVQAALNAIRAIGVPVLTDGRCLPTITAFEGVDGFEQDVLAGLPSATTELGIRALLSQRSAWEREFQKLNLRFPSDWRVWRRDVAPRGALARNIDEAVWEAKRRDRLLWRLLHPATVAVVGPANVGKSTLVNRLLGRERSIVADLPGTTRDWVAEQADLDGLPVLLVDTPGQRVTVDPIERAAMQLAHDVVQAADLVVVVVDGSIPPDASSVPLLDRWPRGVHVANKCDLPPASDCGALGLLPVSAKTGIGMERLVRAIQSRLGLAEHDGGGLWSPEQPRWWLDEHFEAVGASIGPD